MFFVVLRESHTWEKCGSSVMAQVISSVLCMEKSSKEGSTWDYHSCYVMARCTSCPTTPQSSSIISKKSIDILHVLRGDNDQGKWHQRITFGCVWSFKSFFHSDCRIIWLSVSVERINWILIGINHQGKVAPEATTFGWVWLFVSLVQSNYRILWSAISWERNKWYICFLHEGNHNKAASKITTSVGCGQVCLWFNHIAGLPEQQY